LPGEFRLLGRRQLTRLFVGNGEFLPNYCAECHADAVVLTTPYYSRRAKRVDVRMLRTFNRESPAAVDVVQHATTDGVCGLKIDTLQRTFRRSKVSFGVKDSSGDNGNTSRSCVSFEKENDRELVGLARPEAFYSPTPTGSVGDWAASMEERTYCPAHCSLIVYEGPRIGDGRSEQRRGQQGNRSFPGHLRDR